jgi:DNA primase
MKPSGHQLRGTCPCGQSEDPRALALTPSKGLWFCHGGQVGGDVIGLVAHVLELSQKDAAEWLADTLPQTGTVPQKQEGRTEKSQPASTFDPEKFAAKLVWSQEVAATGISQEDAQRLSIGWHPQRKAVYFPVRNPDGSISGFVGFKNGHLLWPPRWMPSNVVPLQRRA